MVYALIPKKVLDEHNLFVTQSLEVKEDGMVVIPPAKMKFITFSLKGIDLLTEHDIVTRYKK